LAGALTTTLPAVPLLSITRVLPVSSGNKIVMQQFALQPTPGSHYLLCGEIPFTLTPLCLTRDPKSKSRSNQLPVVQPRLNSPGPSQLSSMALLRRASVGSCAP
uniref:Uncharacterized protein n=1 Tax=Scleropages formosus TaxID=113540 RepID=A0A8C9RIQ8_SCLFO